mmetsp:Transcript_5776/g.9204  ORF Transcript_5776/g.9204 Transcript_5776/m.9204 type:complete len:109 (+) Transcript_5776:2210-2536(+)
MMENESMNDIMNTFAEKILLNLVYQARDPHEASQIVDSSLEVFTYYTQSMGSCRIIGKTPIMKQLISTGNFSILQHPSQLKKLGKFYKILINLWLQDDYLQGFEENIS